MSAQEQEQIWVKRLTQDDEQAFCRLYASYKNRLMFFALKMLKSQEYAEDIFQDTFMAVWNHRKFVNADQPFGPFVYTIMRNRIMNLLSELNNNEQLAKNIYQQSIEYEESFSPTTEIVEGKELMSLYESAIDTLTPQQRQVFRLSREEMLSHKEIAEQLHLSVSTVQQHLSAALKHLRAALAPHTGTRTNLLLLLFLLDKAL